MELGGVSVDLGWWLFAFIFEGTLRYGWMKKMRKRDEILWIFDAAHRSIWRFWI